jgi:hypothetical protein
MYDETETIRRNRLAEINTADTDRAALEAKYGQVWNTEELARDFIVTGFMAPLVVARRKSDNQVGSLEFSHNPRFYFNWVPDSK